MYTRFFGLGQIPFSIAPDPRYLFMSERHREALAHLLYGLNGGGGFVLLTGEIGAGKTTVCRLFLEQIPAHCNVAYIFNPKQTVIELLGSICDEFGIAVGERKDRVATIKDFIDPLNAFLLASHALQQNNVLIIDEAQNLSADVLEQLRLLTNLETNQRKLLQIILIGQPELRSMLAKPELEQLAQRVIARFHLAALSPDETAQYIAHRLAVAGIDRASPFSLRIMRRIHRRARGVPRLINLLCDRALLGAYGSGKKEIDARTVDMAAREIFDLDHMNRKNPRWRWQSALAGFVMAALLMAIAVGQFGWPGVVGHRVAAASKSQESMPPAPVTPVRPTMTMELALLAKAGKPDAPATAEAAPLAVRVPAPAAATTPDAARPDDAARPEKPVLRTIGQDARSLPEAHRRLADAWQLTGAGTDSCRALQKQNVYCYVSKSGLAEIRQLDRPCLLTLYDDDNEKYYALLIGLTRDTATLRIGDVTESVTLNALAKRWRGGFTTLWQGPIGYEKDILSGDQGSAIEWLATRLAMFDGAEPPPHPAFDAAMSARVREFQLAQGLAPDGLPGAQTLIRLGSVVGGHGPRLQNGPLSVAATAVSPTAGSARK
jgi:general secretion pathway protein A